VEAGTWSQNKSQIPHGWRNGNVKGADPEDLHNLPQALHLLHHTRSVTFAWTPPALVEPSVMVEAILHTMGAARHVHAERR
jgi:hypothetical protein